MVYLKIETLKGAANVTREMLEKLKKVLREDVKFAVHLVNCEGAENFQNVLAQYGFDVPYEESCEIYETFQAMAKGMGLCSDQRSNKALMLSDCLDTCLDRKENAE